MLKKTFKGLELPFLGLGGLRFPTAEGGGVDWGKAREIVRTAMDCGINFFDTSHIYMGQDSERLLGEALDEYPRGAYFLCSKFYAKYATDIQATFREQLARCRTDYFDFYLLHGVDENFMDSYMDPSRGYLDFLLAQRDAGRIRYIGFSSHATPEGLERFLNWYDKFDMAMIQINYLDWELLEAKRQYDLLTARGIPIWVMEPLKGGILSNLPPAAEQILTEAVPNRTASSWGMRFLMSLDNVQMVLSGMSSVEQVKENARIFSQPAFLGAPERLALERAAEVLRTTLGVACSACRYCCDACPAALNIPLLIQGYNEYKLSGETWRLAELTHATGPSACLRCGVCLKYCPQKIDIPEVMSAFAKVWP